MFFIALEFTLGLKYYDIVLMTENDILLTTMYSSIMLLISSFLTKICDFFNIPNPYICIPVNKQYHYKDPDSINDYKKPSSIKKKFITLFMYSNQNNNNNPGDTSGSSNNNNNNNNSNNARYTFNLTLAEEERFAARTGVGQTSRKDLERELTQLGQKIDQSNMYIRRAKALLDYFEIIPMLMSKIVLIFNT